VRYAIGLSLLLLLGVALLSGCTSPSGSPPGGSAPPGAGTPPGSPARPESSGSALPSGAGIDFGDLAANYFEISNARFEMKQFTHPSTGKVDNIPILSFLARARHKMFMSPEFRADFLDANGVTVDRRMVYFGGQIGYAGISAYLEQGQQLWGWVIVPDAPFTVVRFVEGIP
jgi:hypothetical protein